MAASPEELLRAIEGLRDDVAKLRRDASTPPARWPSVLAGAVAVGLAIGATLWAAGDDDGSGTGSGEIAKALNDVRSRLSRIEPMVDTLTKDLPSRLNRIESDVHALGAGVASSSSALRSILSDTDLSETDKDRVAQLATESIRETINREPDGTQARALRDLMAAADDADKASFERKAKAAREVLRPIFESAAGKAGLGPAAIRGVANAVGSATTDTVRYLARELPSALIGGLIGVALAELFDDTEKEFDEIGRELEKIKGACGKCNAACEGQPKPPAPPGTANGRCPGSLTDPDSTRFYFDSGEHELFCRSDATTRCAQRRRENQAKIEAIVKLARDRASATLLIWAHTDTVGRRDFNDDLARKRSDAVREALINVGMSADRILEFPMGERVLATAAPPADEKPSADNRVVIVALGYRGPR
jgi:outer membrane protein OmpA-like peptidoglycan-associated protein